MKYWYTYYARRVPIKLATPLYRGKLWDNAVGLLWHSGAFVAQEYLEREITEHNEILIIKLIAAISYYNVRRGELSDRLGGRVTLESQQQRKTINVVNPHDGQKVCELLTVTDTILSTDRGKVILETKLTESDISEGSGFWIRKPNFDLQTSIYFLAHPNIKEVVLDVTKIGKHAPAKEDITNAAKKKMVELGMMLDHPSAPVHNVKSELESIKGNITERETIEQFEQRMLRHYEGGSQHVMKGYPKIDKHYRQAAENCFAACTLVMLANQYQLFPRNAGSCQLGQYRCAYYPVCNDGESIMNNEIYKDK
jgi:hypothetical protein